MPAGFGMIDGGDLRRLLNGGARDDTGSNWSDGKGGTPIPEAVIEMMKEVSDRYGKPCPFKPGDIVTPHSSSDLRQPGTPHIVLEVKELPPEAQLGEVDDSDPQSSSSGFGRRLDMRFLAYYEGHLSAFWGESWQFVPWTPQD